MDKAKLKHVEDTEACLFLMHVWLKDMEQKLISVNDNEQRRAILQELEEGRIRFSQIMADVVIFKAKHQIYTLPKQLK